MTGPHRRPLALVETPPWLDPPDDDGDDIRGARWIMLGVALSCAVWLLALLWLASVWL